MGGDCAWLVPGVWQVVEVKGEAAVYPWQPHLKLLQKPPSPQPQSTPILWASVTHTQENWDPAGRSMRGHLHATWAVQLASDK